VGVNAVLSRLDTAQADGDVTAEVHEAALETRSALASWLVGRLGLEPRTHGLKVRCSTIELTPRAAGRADATARSVPTPGAGPAFGLQLSPDRSMGAGSSCRPSCCDVPP
jgi:hypothetical protein